MQPSEKQLRDAVSVITRDYYADVSGVVDDVIDAHKRGEITSREGALEYVEQSVDGCQRVIYTWQARLGLLASENCDAYFDEYGDTLSLVNDGAINWSVLMYAAMLRDVIDELARRGKDINDDDAWGPDESEGKEGEDA